MKQEIKNKEVYVKYAKKEHTYYVAEGFNIFLFSFCLKEKE